MFYSGSFGWTVLLRAHAIAINIQIHWIYVYSYTTSAFDLLSSVANHIAATPLFRLPGSNKRKLDCGSLASVFTWILLSCCFVRSNCYTAIVDVQLWLKNGFVYYCMVSCIIYLNKQFCCVSPTGSWQMSHKHDQPAIKCDWLEIARNWGHSSKCGVFLPARRYASAVFATATCLDVRPSVRLSHAGIVPSTAKAGSWNVHHLIAPSVHFRHKVTMGR